MSQTTENVNMEQYAPSQQMTATAPANSDVEAQPEVRRIVDSERWTTDAL
jgi:hypothetical protein